MRLGLFGGTFDPPHRGHLAVARAAGETFALSRVLLAPTGRQPLKAAGAHASFAHRFAMVQLLAAEAGMPPGGGELEASAIDGPRPDGTANYTIDTVRTLNEQMGRLKSSDPGPALFVIVGADAFLHLRHWREPDALLREAEWIVVSRPGCLLAASGLAEEDADRVHRLTGLQEPASSTEIRRRLHDGLDCSDFLTPAVREYIDQHDLYRSVPAVGTDEQV